MIILYTPNCCKGKMFMVTSIHDVSFTSKHKYKNTNTYLIFFQYNTLQIPFVNGKHVKGNSLFLFLVSNAMNLFHFKYTTYRRIVVFCHLKECETQNETSSHRHTQGQPNVKCILDYML